MMSRDWSICFLDLALEAVSGVRVGVGRAATVEVGTDLPVLRTPDGNPVIPGSSFKGVLRSAAERLLRAHNVSLACDPLASPCIAGSETPTYQELEDRLCWTCKLFGNPHWAARIQVGDLVARGARTFVRDGVAIDRAESKAADRLKYDYEVVAPGAVFEGRIRMEDPAEGEVGLILAILDLIDLGVVTVGGGASRGLGRLRVTRTIATTVRASAFPVEPALLDLEGERRAFQNRFGHSPRAGR